MASLTRYSKGYKVRYRIFYPDGTSRLAYVYRSRERDARHLLGLAHQLESLTRQNALSREIATPFLHWRLLFDLDLAQWFGERQHAYDPDILVDAYEQHCQTRMTSVAAIKSNLSRARYILRTWPRLDELSPADLRAWQQRRLTERARKTVRHELITGSQLIELCIEFGWRDDNPIKRLRMPSVERSRLPRPLTRDEVRKSILIDSGDKIAYRVIVAGIYLGLRRGEIQHLMAGDTDKKRVIIQSKILPDGGEWQPKNRRPRIIQYAGIETAISHIWHGVDSGYVMARQGDSSRTYSADTLTRMVGAILKQVGHGITLHSLRHTFACWRIAEGDNLLSVRQNLGHASLSILEQYTHVAGAELTGLLDILDSSKIPPLPQNSPSQTQQNQYTLHRWPRVRRASKKTP